MLKDSSFFTPQDRAKFTNDFFTFMVLLICLLFGTTRRPRIPEARPAHLAPAGPCTRRHYWRTVKCW
jgi:hypothetical protein